ncbi:aminotransferase class V-fold PLP-dependent enzyme [Thermosulfuriphilus sp.]
MRQVVYADNAATSWPKPDVVVEATAKFLRTCSASPGRAGHQMALKASRVIFEAREELAALIGAPSSEQVIFTKNATEALNLALFGLLRPGDLVITTSIEHNAVARPLYYLQQTRGIKLLRCRCHEDGSLDFGHLRDLVSSWSPRLIVINHASNVTGTILSVAEVAELKGEALLLVDAAQTAGVLDIDVSSMGIDLLALTGHKSLLGPTGTGALYLASGLEENLEPLGLGGTGSRSESLEQPLFLPDRFESGTPNTVGIAGLLAGLKFLKQEGLARIRTHEQGLTGLFLERLSPISGITIYGPCDPQLQTAVVSINVAGMDPAEVALRLDRDYGIAVRAGLQCAPWAHQTIGTYPQGTVRFSWGYFNELSDVEAAVQALAEIAKKR